ncbi:hypothetical protein A2U01_0058844 [Trifolium medium]|uniref:Uncharacterized protein n=1 Tax=Trifolium medium TaxID=97028 RepID=A0A392RPD1_9FABA|nr:hypothetical protein [Trifolium medium]
MFQFNAHPGMIIHQVLCSIQMPHQSVCPSHRRRHTAMEGGVHDSPDSIHPERGSDAPAVSESVSEIAPSDLAAGGTVGSMKGSESEPYNPGR